MTFRVKDGLSVNGEIVIDSDRTIFTKQIESTDNQDIDIAPDGTGQVTINQIPVATIALALALA